MEPPKDISVQSQEQQHLGEGRYSLKEIFGKVKGGIFRNHSYYINQVPDAPRISNMSQLESQKPFFIINPVLDGWRTNREVVPFVFDEKIGNSERFINAEALTEGDSGLLALCAVSADPPEQQARLYRTVAGTILAVHRNNPNLIRDWLMKQISLQDQRYSSLNIFAQFDLERFEKSESLDEVLLPFSSGAIDPNLAPSMWKDRILELGDALRKDQLEFKHLRWTEFLAHSVDIQKLFQSMQTSANSLETAARISQLQQARARVGIRPTQAARVNQQPRPAVQPQPKRERYRGWNPFKILNQYALDEKAAVEAQHQRTRNRIASTNSIGASWRFRNVMDFIERIPKKNESDPTDRK